MKRKLTICALMTVALLFFIELSPAQGFIKEFSLKVSGGYGTMSVGDTNDLFKSNMAFIDTFIVLAQSLGISASKTGEAPELDKGTDLFAEFIAHLNENFGVGVGFGYMQRTSEGDMTLTISQQGFGEMAMNWKAEPKITAYPVFLSAYYFHPLVEKLSIFLNAGVGLYFGKHSWKGSTTVSDQEFSEVSTDTASFSGKAFGFHGGFGAEYKVSPNIAIFVEGKGRSATIGNLEGDLTYKDDWGTDKHSGTVWYTEISDTEFNVTQIGAVVDDQKPTDSWLKNVRKWTVNLSGFTGIIGIRISFGGRNVGE